MSVDGQHAEEMDEFDDENNNGDDELLDAEEQNATTGFEQHGGDPRDLDLSRSLLVTKLPTAFLNDDFEVFSECVSELLTEEFKITREAVEKIVRIPKLQPDAESEENALRAIVLFKSRVHKHRVVAQKKLATLDGTLSVTPIDEIPAEMLELEMSEIIGGDDTHGDDSHNQGEDQIDLDENNEDRNKSQKIEVRKKEPVVNAAKVEPKKTVANETTKAETEEAEHKKKEHQKKAYIDDDLKAPFEISWDGAPEFQWKICSSPADTRCLTIENLFYSDLRNPFIYRVMIRAESVDTSFPMRFNLQGNKQMYGKLVMNFQYPNEVMYEAIRHLIYVRCADSRRIKVYLPQSPVAMKLKDELEEKLGHLIQPTRRMHQLVLKVLPTEEYTIEDVKSWFPEAADQITNWEQIADEIGQSIGLVTFATPDAVVLAHGAHTFLNVATSTDRTAKVHVFMRGVEAHFGSFLTRWDQKKAREFYGEPPRQAVKRPAITESRGIPQKRTRGVPGHASRGFPHGGYSTSNRGRPAYGSSYGRDPAPFASGYARPREEGSAWRMPSVRYNEHTRYAPSSGYDNRRDPYGGYSRR